MIIVRADVKILKSEIREASYRTGNYSDSNYLAKGKVCLPNVLMVSVKVIRSELMVTLLIYPLPFALNIVIDFSSIVLIY